MATIGSIVGGAYLGLRGGDKKKAPTPPLNASSKDEEAFIQYGDVPPSPFVGDGLLTI
jgi:F-type H+-transporting ATPase subunit k